MPRSVDEVKAVRVILFGRGILRQIRRGPKSSRRGRRNRDTTLTLLYHPVHDRVTGVHLTDLVVYTRVEQYALRSRGLSCVDVGDDTKVAGFLERVLTGHDVFLLLINAY